MSLQRNQVADLQHKSTDWFLYDDSTELWSLSGFLVWLSGYLFSSPKKNLTFNPLCNISKIVMKRGLQNNSWNNTRNLRNILLNIIQWHGKKDLAQFKEHGKKCVTTSRKSVDSIIVFLLLLVWPITHNTTVFCLQLE